MTKHFQKQEILAASSGWVAVLLNLLPGLGTGYIYQRRWIPYFLSAGASTAWFVLGVIILRGDEPNNAQQIIGLLGFSLISLATSIESLLAHKKALKVLNERIEIKETPKKKSWFRK